MNWTNKVYYKAEFNFREEVKIDDTEIIGKVVGVQFNMHSMPIYEVRYCNADGELLTIWVDEWEIERV